MLGVALPFLGPSFRTFSTLLSIWNPSPTLLGPPLHVQNSLPQENKKATKSNHSITERANGNHGPRKRLRPHLQDDQVRQHPHPVALQPLSLRPPLVDFRVPLLQDPHLPVLYPERLREGTRLRLWANFSGSAGTLWQTKCWSNRARLSGWMSPVKQVSCDGSSSELTPEEPAWVNLFLLLG